MNTRIERALRRAAEWHAGQTRKGSATPYVAHPFAVAWLLNNALVASQASGALEAVRQSALAGLMRRQVQG